MPPVCTAASQLRWPGPCSGKLLSPGEAFSQVLPRSWAGPLCLNWEAWSLLQCLVVPLAWPEAGRVAFEAVGTFQSNLGLWALQMKSSFFLAKGQLLNSPLIKKIKLKKKKEEDKTPVCEFLQHSPHPWGCCSLFHLMLRTAQAQLSDMPKVTMLVGGETRAPLRPG